VRDKVLGRADEKTEIDSPSTSAEAVMRALDAATSKLCRRTEARHGDRHHQGPPIRDHHPARDVETEGSCAGDGETHARSHRFT